MTTAAPVVNRTASSASRVLTILLPLAIVVIQFVLTRQQVKLFWADYGRWLYEIDRAAHGARIYQDIGWPFPPLAYWLFGAAGRIIGTDLAQIQSLTFALALGIAAVYALIVRRLISPSLAPIVAAAGMWLGAIYSQQGSAPLVLGMYTPAAPLALFFLLLQLYSWLRFAERPSALAAAIVGLFGALGVLTKHDVWLPCTGITAAVLLVDRSFAQRWRYFAIAAATGIVVAVAAIAPIAYRIGVVDAWLRLSGRVFWQALRGVDHTDASHLVLEVASLAICLGVTAVFAALTKLTSWGNARRLIALCCAAGVAAAAIWLWQANRVGVELVTSGRPPFPNPFEATLLPGAATWVGRVRAGTRSMLEALPRHLLPMGALLLAAIVTWRSREADSYRTANRRILVLLLAVAILLRFRREVTFAEWSHRMIDVVALAFFAEFVWHVALRPVQRVVTSVLALLCLVALYSQWSFGFGPLTRRASLIPVATPRGTAYMARNVAADLMRIMAEADSIDPSRTRPILAFGYSSAFAYFTGRTAPVGFSHGLSMAPFKDMAEVERVLQTQRQQLLLVDNPFLGMGLQSPDRDWGWQPKMVPNHFQRDDRLLFDRLASQCRPRGAASAKPRFRLFDCSLSATPGTGA